MAAVEHVKIEIEEDFMARQTRAEPVHALAELIWNSVDADASRVTVEFEFKDLAQGMSKIVVYDDGQGIPRDQARQLFGHLGTAASTAKTAGTSRAASRDDVICNHHRSHDGRRSAEIYHRTGEHSFRAGEKRATEGAFTAS
jgi:histidine kinase/DNA gyrase B/HSP90-like ATPase